MAQWSCRCRATTLRIMSGLLSRPSAAPLPNCAVKVLSNSKPHDAYLYGTLKNCPAKYYRNFRKIAVNGITLDVNNRYSISDTRLWQDFERSFGLKGDVCNKAYC